MHATLAESLHSTVIAFGARRTCRRLRGGGRTCRCDQIDWGNERKDGSEAYEHKFDRATQRRRAHSVPVSERVDTYGGNEEGERDRKCDAMRNKIYFVTANVQ